MAWESHGTRRYYYRVRKVRGRVVREYVGTGPLAELAALDDSEVRAEREARQAEAREQHERDRKLDAQLAAVDVSASTLTVGTLLAAGYHRHHGGEWRRLRERR